MTLRTRLDRLEAAAGQGDGAEALLIRTGVPRADDPSGIVALVLRPSTTTQGARP